MIALQKSEKVRDKLYDMMMQDMEKLLVRKTEFVSKFVDNA